MFNFNIKYTHTPFLIIIIYKSHSQDGPNIIVLYCKMYIIKAHVSTLVFMMLKFPIQNDCNFDLFNTVLCINQVVNCSQISVEQSRRPVVMLYTMPVMHDLVQLPDAWIQRGHEPSIHFSQLGTKFCYASMVNATHICHLLGSKLEILNWDILSYVSVQ